MNVCRLFGLGLEPKSTVDALFVLANLSYCLYGYDHVTSVVQQRMPFVWDITTVMSVAKVYTYLLTPLLMLIMWQYNKRSLSDAMSELDHAMTETAAATPLAPFAWYSAAWLCMSVLIEFSAYTMFHLDTNFEYFTMTEYGMIFVYNVWSKVPLLMYTFLMDTIRTAIQDINGRLTTVAEWQTYRGQWDDLRRAAVHLARHQFGVTIVTFIVCTIAEIVFYVFMLYLFGYNNKNALRILIYFINAMFSASWMFEVIRMSKNCKSELLKTQKVLNSININFNSDYRQAYYQRFELYVPLNNERFDKICFFTYVTCRFQFHAMQYFRNELQKSEISKYYKISPYMAMKEIFDNGPITTQFYMFRDLVDYKSGVYQYDKQPNVDFFTVHSVQIIGWGEENGDPYWLVVNSFGTDWGHNGTFKISRGNDGCFFQEKMYAGLPF
ncbi:hypothetical protein QTP88_017970 [Uroleucon formosanum]